MMLSSVDLPQPLGPTRQRKPPTLTCSETASSACTSPPRPVKNRFETRSTARAVARTPPVWYVAIRGWRFVSRPARKEIGTDALAHLSHLLPLGREHINLTWDYIWHSNKRVTQGRFRPLRAPHKKVSGLSRSLQGDLRHREKVGQLLPWRLVIDRRFHRLIYLFGREEHGRLHTGRAG